ncbi:MAG: Uma2 family endonuclease [Thiotrichaceae bacterium]
MATNLMTRDAYLQLAQTTDVKHEFYQGEIFAMSGGTFNHARISGNILVSLSITLRGKSCQPMNSDMRIHTPSGLDTYPDISVYCNQPILIDNERTLLNPVMIIEVLSPSTRNYDRSEKFWHYRTITTVQDYLLVDSARIFIEHFHRVAEGWLLHDYAELTNEIVFPTISATVSLQDIYAEVYLD